MADAFTAALIAAMAHSTEPMVLSDPHLPDCPVIAANAAFEALTGYSHHEIIGRNCRFMQGPRTDRVSADRIRGFLSTGQGCVEWIVNHRKNGTAFWNLLFLSPVSGADGQLRYFFGNQLDITEGPPTWLSEFQLGGAHMAPEAELEFKALVAAIAADAAIAATDREQQARSLERAVMGARRLSELTRRLAPEER